jgi:hypothetical protein
MYKSIVSVHKWMMVNLYVAEIANTKLFVRGLDAKIFYSSDIKFELIRTIVWNFFRVI